MSAAVRFQNVSLNDCLCRFSMEIPAGCTALLLTSRPEESLAIAHLICGLLPPDEGQVEVLDQNPALLQGAPLYRLRRQMGIVPPEGGLISNLKMWENIVLPKLYLDEKLPPATEERILGQLKGFGYDKNLMALPAHLNQYEKIVAAFIRATLLDPRLVVYCDCLEGIPELQRGALLTAFGNFQMAAPGRTSIYLASSPDAERQLRCDHLFRTGEREGTPCS